MATICDAVWFNGTKNEARESFLIQLFFLLLSLSLSLSFSHFFFLSHLDMKKLHFQKNSPPPVPHGPQAQIECFRSALAAVRAGPRAERLFAERALVASNWSVFVFFVFCFVFFLLSRSRKLTHFLPSPPPPTKAHRARRHGRAPGPSVGRLRGRQAAGGSHQIPRRRQRPLRGAQSQGDAPVPKGHSLGAAGVPGAAGGGAERRVAAARGGEGARGQQESQGGVLRKWKWRR